MNTWAKWIGKRRLSHIGLMGAVTCCILFVAFSEASGAQPMVAAGTGHIVGLKSDGTVVAAGGNVFGQLEVSSWSDIVQVAAGEWHTVGLKSDGTVVAVGWNNYGQLEVSSWTDIVQIDTSWGNTVGLKSDGTVVAVGDSDYGKLEVSSWTDIVQVAAGGQKIVGLKSNGTVVGVGLSVVLRELEVVSSWTDIVQIAPGGGHTVGLKSNGTVVTAGDGDYGKLEVSSWTDIVQVAAGANHTVGLKSDGVVVGVGSMYFREPILYSWTDIVQIAAGGGLTVVLKSDGTVFAVDVQSFDECNVYDWNLYDGEFFIFADFNTDAQGFSYSDDPFHNTHRPAYASGDHSSRKGYGGTGGLHVVVGDVDGKHVLDGMSGGWSKDFDLDYAAVVEISLKYRLMTTQYDADECGEALVAIDGDPVMQLDKLCGRGLDTGWKTKTFRQTLSAGGHTLTVGAYNNKKTGMREKTDAYFDDIAVKIVPVLSTDFDGSDHGFIYGDDTFYDTNRPQYASGDYTAVGGTSGSGGLHLTLGNVEGRDILDGISGGWTGRFHLDDALDVKVSLVYRLIMTQFDADECAQVLAKVDDGPAEVLEELCGRGKDTGWQTTTFMQYLPAGDHTITIGGYNNKKTGPREVADIYFDNLEIK